MTKTMTKKTDVAGRKPAETTQASNSSVPVWKAQHGRVQAAMWRHPQDDGSERTTLSISRSYRDKDDDKWKNVHFYDPRDIADIRSILSVVEEEILSLDGKETVVGED